MPAISPLNSTQDRVFMNTLLLPARVDACQKTQEGETKSKWILVRDMAGTVLTASVTTALYVTDDQIEKLMLVTVFGANLLVYWEALRGIGKSYENKRSIYLLAICAVLPTIFLSLDAWEGMDEVLGRYYPDLSIYSSKVMPIFVFALFLGSLAPHSLMMRSLTHAYQRFSLTHAYQRFLGLRASLKSKREDILRCLLRFGFLLVAGTQLNLMISVSKGGWEALVRKSKSAFWSSAFCQGWRYLFLAVSIFVRMLLIFMRLLNLEKTIPQLWGNFRNRPCYDRGALPSQKRCGKWLANFFMSLLGILFIFGNGFANGQLATYAARSQPDRSIAFIGNFLSSFILCSATVASLLLNSSQNAAPANQEDSSPYENHCPASMSRDGALGELRGNDYKRGSTPIVDEVGSVTGSSQDQGDSYQNLAGLDDSSCGSLSCAAVSPVASPVMSGTDRQGILARVEEESLQGSPNDYHQLAAASSPPPP